MLIRSSYAHIHQEGGRAGQLPGDQDGAVHIIYEPSDLPGVDVSGVVDPVPIVLYVDSSELPKLDPHPLSSHTLSLVEPLKRI